MKKVKILLIGVFALTLALAQKSSAAMDTFSKPEGTTKKGAERKTLKVKTPASQSVKQKFGKANEDNALFGSGGGGGKVNGTVKAGPKLSGPSEPQERPAPASAAGAAGNQPSKFAGKVDQASPKLFSSGGGAGKIRSMDKKGKGQPNGNQPELVNMNSAPGTNNSLIIGVQKGGTLNGDKKASGDGGKKAVIDGNAKEISGDAKEINWGSSKHLNGDSKETNTGGSKSWFKTNGGDGGKSNLIDSAGRKAGELNGRGAMDGGSKELSPTAVEDGKESEQGGAGGKNSAPHGAGEQGAN